MNKWKPGKSNALPVQFFIYEKKTICHIYSNYEILILNSNDIFFLLKCCNCHQFAGGYTTGSKELIDLLRNRSRPYLFSNSLPPPVVATASKVFELLMKSSELIEKLAANTHRFRNRMSEAGFTVLVSATYLI